MLVRQSTYIDHSKQVGEGRYVLVRQSTYIDHSKQVGEGRVGDEQEDCSVDAHDALLLQVQAEIDQTNDHANCLGKEVYSYSPSHRDKKNSSTLKRARPKSNQHGFGSPIDLSSK